MDEQFSWRKTVGKELGALWKIPMIQKFPLHRFIVMKGSVIYELYETWCCESTNTVDGSEIRRSPVDMAVYPMIYKGFIHLQVVVCLGFLNHQTVSQIMQKTTPRKINMEHNHGGLEDHFLSKWVICRFPVNLPGWNSCEWTQFFFWEPISTFQSRPFGHGQKKSDV